MTVRYIYVVPMKKKKSISFAMIFLTSLPNRGIRNAHLKNELANVSGDPWPAASA